MLPILIHKILSLALMMACGYLLLRCRIFTEADSKSLSLLIVHLVLPCSIFSAFQMERTPEVLRGLLLTLLAAVLVHLFMILLTRILRKPLKLDPVEQASLLYTNAGNLIIPLVAASLGPDWVIYSSAYVLVMTLLTWTHGKALICGRWDSDPRSLLKNTNILAILLGVLFFGMNWQLPSLLKETVSGMGSMVGPLSMLVTGMLLATVKPRQVLGNLRVFLVSGLRLLVFPLLCMGLLAGLLVFFPQDAPYFLVTMLATAAPSAGLITNIAQIYDREPGYASSLNAVTTVLCIATIPLVISIYMAIFLP